jgi:GNAT superfamily N-acetyltransferase
LIATTRDQAAAQPASRYSVFETLRDGTRIEVRALRGDDRADLLDAFDRLSAQSRYTRFFAPKRDLSEAEIAFAVDDSFQGRGVASAVIRNLVVLARAAGLDTFHAEVLAENAPMLRVFEKSGLAMTKTREQGVVRATLRLH